MGYRAKRLRVISVHDDAIETERMPEPLMVRYFETRDENIIKPFIKPGSTPTWFTIGEAPHAVWGSYILAAPSEAMGHIRAFQACIKTVENVRQSDGPVLTSWEPPTNSNGVTHEEALERFSPQELSEIGAVAFTHSFFPLRMQVTYPLPLSSLGVLAKRTFLRVVASPSLPAPINDEASSDSKAATPSSQPETESSNAA